MIEIVGRETPLIPNGNYEAVCLGNSLKDFRGNGKLTLIFQIVGGAHDRTELGAHFNVELKRVVGGGTTFAVLQRSKYLRMMRRLFETVEAAGGDFLAPDNLDGRRVRVEVETVTTDYKREPLNPKDQYSKVSEVLALLE